jgi:nucleoside-diphosphate-sugar epimerase
LDSFTVAVGPSKIIAPGLNEVSTMKVLIIGGTRFIGPAVARNLVAEGHSVIVFHRGQTSSELPESVSQVYGERKNLFDFKGEFEALAPEVVLDMIAYTEQDARDIVKTFDSIARRAVMISSMDVYLAYGQLLGLESGPPPDSLLREDSPLRTFLYPYRKQAASEKEFTYNYEKILVEQTMLSLSAIPTTIMRLPAVYGPGDHRLFQYLKRMDDKRPVILLDEGMASWRWTRGYVEDVAAAIARAVTDERAAGRIYNVGEKEALTEREWVGCIAEAANWEGEIKTTPGQSLPAHLTGPYDWRYHLAADTTRIRDELGYQETISRDKAISLTVEGERTCPPETIDPAQFDYDAEDQTLARLNNDKSIDHG